MTDCATRTYRFPTPVGVPLEAALDAGRLTSDGGPPWLAAAEQALGRCAAVRGPGRVCA